MMRRRPITEAWARPSGSAFGRDSTSSSRAAIQGAIKPDALHLAAAMKGGCHLFLSNDHRLGGFPALTVEVLS